MKTTQNRGLTFFRTAGLLAVLVALLLPASASATDSIYWSNEDGSNSIRYGPLSGDNGGSTPAQTLFNDGGVLAGWRSTPRPARPTGRTGTRGRSGSATWTARERHRPSSTRLGNVCGVAVDPANDKIYWANFSTQEIRVGNLDGTGTPLTLFTDPGGSDPSGVAIDPADNKIYWTNQHSDQVRVGNLDGTGSASTLFGGDVPSQPPRTTRSASRSTPRPARSTGPTLSAARSGSGPWGQQRGQPTTLFFAPAERAGGRPYGEQDLLGQLDVRLGDPGREPATARASRPCLAARAPRSSPRC